MAIEFSPVHAIPGVRPLESAPISPPRSIPETAIVPVDQVSLVPAAVAALELGLLRGWSSATSREISASASQMAQVAAQKGEIELSPVPSISRVRPAEITWILPPQSVPETGTRPVDHVSLLPEAVAALELDFLREWHTVASHENGVAEFQMARAAAQSRDTSGTLRHLERAIAAYPTHVEAAFHDVAFTEMRRPVIELMARLSTLARMQAEAAVIHATAALDSAGDVPAQAAVYVDLAQRNLLLGCYTGYLGASWAAARAQKLVTEPPVPTGHRMSQVVRIRFLRDVVGPPLRRMWRRLPLLMILLGWFFAGLLFGLLTLPFGADAADFRAILFPVWAIGLLGLIVTGVLRSLLIYHPVRNP